MAEVVSTGVSHMCDNSTVSVTYSYLKRMSDVNLINTRLESHNYDRTGWT